MTQRIFKDPDFRGAFRLHEQFREAKPTRVRRVVAPKIPRALMQLGELEFVGYRTTHNGEVARYMHKFAPGSMPRLMAGPKRGQLFLIGGRYHVTDRGIVDLDARGQEIDDGKHNTPVAEPRVQNPVSFADEPPRRGSTHRLVFKLRHRDFEEFSDHKSYALADKRRKRIQSMFKPGTVESWRIETLDGDSDAS